MLAFFNADHYIHKVILVLSKQILNRVVAGGVEYLNEEDRIRQV